MIKKIIIFILMIILFISVILDMIFLYIISGIGILFIMLNDRWLIESRYAEKWKLK